MDIKLISENDPLLRDEAEPWDFSVDGDPSELIKSMTKVMFLGGGIGLAAPQIGVSKRIFIMGNEDLLVACINPEIISGKDRIREQEGCLSFPNLWMYVERYKSIRVKYYNAAGEKIEQEYQDLAARVFQHETDHLNGICFDTRVGQLTLKLARDRRKKKTK